MAIALDIETDQYTYTEPYALQPFRVAQKKSRITCITVVNGESRTFEDLDEFRQYLPRLHGEEVYCHNTLFDVSFLIATFGYEAVKHIRWRDTMLLYKYLVNGQKIDKDFSFSLYNCVKRVVKEHPDLDEFLNMKKQDVVVGIDKEYWLRRNVLDTTFTSILAEMLLLHLSNSSKPGYLCVCGSILPLARGYVHGILVDKDAHHKAKQYYMDKQNEILKELNLDASVLTSHKQLGNLLFNEWGIEPVAFTPKGQPSVNAESMLRLFQTNSDSRLKKISEHNKCATMLSKYINGIENSISHIGDNRLHAQPWILSTITGRMTYSSKIKEYQVSIALHQLPRKDKLVKKCLIAPKGYKIFYLDFSSQEARIMADICEDKNMLDAFNSGKDIHAILTEDIFGTPYDDIVKANKDGSPEEIVEQRQAGKLTVLSSFYRIGAQSLANKFFATYEYDITVQTAQSYLKAFKSTFNGIPKYWDKAIALAKYHKYAIAYGGFKYGIDKLDWKGESSAINHPIQGGAAMLTYAAISIICRKWPDLILVSQVHDSLACYIPEEGAEGVAREIISYMSNYDYGKLLGFNQKVKFILEGGIGDNFADIKNV